MHYRRARLKGGVYFFTVVTHNRLPLFDDPAHVILLGEALQHVKSRHPLQQHAYVILPDHIHCIWQLPEDSDDFSLRWRLIKHYVSGKAPHQTFWQKRFWEHLIRDENDYRRHLDYIHYNPVKHGLVNHPCEWPHSSYHEYLGKKWYAEDWGDDAPKLEGDFGE
ncbi:MAG: transposase [Gammaproteobacteria bacterium]|nr:transposase [Gammaproteobacteria bacterium]